MKRFTITFALLALFSITVRAQGFDWVKTYSGYWEAQDYPSNYIVGSATDSQGNIYIAGQMVFSAVFAGEDILPFTPTGSDVMLGACILKLSPTGELLWKKALQAKESCSFIHGIQLVGDTALWVCAETSVPKAEDDYLYFYDSLVTPSTRQFLMDDDEHSNGAAMVVTAFDLDGNRRENYFLQLAYKDMEGRMITWRMMIGNSTSLDFVIKQPLFSGTFHVDNQGNIYLGHSVKDRLYMACDTCCGAQEATLANGLLGEVVVMVNGQPSFTDTNTTHPTFSNYRIMKFSPHFDSMLAFHYVFENESAQWAYYTSQQLITDTGGNHLYLMFNIDEPTELADQQLTGSADKVVRLTGMIQGVVVEYDSLLQPLEVYQIEQVQPLLGRAEWSSSFDKMVIDADSNLLFILGNIGDKDPEIDLAVNGQQVEIGDAGNAFFLKTRVGSPTILADGFARSDHATSLWGTMDPKGAVASKGSLYAMVDYVHSIQWRDTSIVLPRAPNGAYNMGEGVFIWSYEGDELDFIDLKKCSTGNSVSSSLALHDSALYICGGMEDDILIADTVIHPAGYSIAYIARYDFSRNNSGNGNDTGSVRITTVDDDGNIVVYPNPTSGRVTVSTSENIVSATLTDMMGRRKEVKLTATGNGQYLTDMTTCSNGVYLLTLTTATGKQHTARLQKQ